VASRALARTDELAVMLDTERPLRLTTEAISIDDPSYPFSWME
jgi:homogentisate 1,2-dioxygenase